MPVHTQTNTRDVLLELMAQRILLLDGAMGTMVFAHKPTEADYRGERFKNHCKELRNFNDILVLTQPKLIESIHAQYLEAGSDIVETNTFNATPIGMVEFGLEPGLVEEINLGAAKLAKHAAEQVHARQSVQAAFCRRQHWTDQQES